MPNIPKTKKDNLIDELNTKFNLIIDGVQHSKKFPMSLLILANAADVQIKKGSDYQYGNRVKQAEYYPSGIQTMNDTINSKVLRIKSLIEKYENGELPINESIEDSFMDIINTASFAITFLRGLMEGQDVTRDFLNKEKK